jgi:hypothetical protein
MSAIELFGYAVVSLFCDPVVALLGDALVVAASPTAIHDDGGRE